MTNLINLTQHEINIFEHGAVIGIKPSGLVARVSTSATRVGTVDVFGKDIDIFSNTYGAIENLPEPEPDTFYIVSRIVKSACPDRNDVLVPLSDVRDDEGRVIGTRGFSL